MVKTVEKKELERFSTQRIRLFTELGRPGVSLSLSLANFSKQSSANAERVESLLVECISPEIVNISLLSSYRTVCNFLFLIFITNVRLTNGLGIWLSRSSAEMTSA